MCQPAPSLKFVMTYAWVLCIHAQYLFKNDIKDTSIFEVIFEEMSLIIISLIFWIYWKLHVEVPVLRMNPFSQGNWIR